MVAYRDKIDYALVNISNFPEIGRYRYGYLIQNVGSHLIFYRVENKAVLVVRILHQKMDPLKHVV